MTSDNPIFGPSKIEINILIFEGYIILYYVKLDYIRL
jgi:hypothetical protein